MEGNAAASKKLRRLRIEEGVLLQNLHKFEQGLREENKTDENDADTTKIKDKYIHVKNLLDEVRVHSNSQELLVDLDINEMENKILHLETSLKSLKSLINIELQKLKSSEKNILKELNESSNEIIKTKCQPKLRAKNYKDIVPSPIKAILTCPFKSVEVQHFQDFMKNSPNRFGGWNEFNHNIFVKFWQKYFGHNYNPAFEDDDIPSKEIYDKFVEAVEPKLHGMKNEDIASHTKWFIKYLYYKQQQQAAINKWKINNRPMQLKKKMAYSTSKCISESVDENVSGCSFLMSGNNVKDEAIKNTNKRNSNKKGTKLRTKSLDEHIKCLESREFNIENLTKPTKQWINRTQQDDIDYFSTCMSSIDDVKKLGVPVWRQYLQ